MLYRLQSPVGSPTAPFPPPHRRRDGERHDISEEPLLERRDRVPDVIAQANKQRHQGEPEGADDNGNDSFGFRSQFYS